MKQSGFTPILILFGILVLVGVVGGAYYFGIKQASVSEPPITISPTSQPTLAPSPDKTDNSQTVFIDKVEPAEGKMGTEITITGRGFDSDNDIGFGISAGGNYYAGYISKVTSFDGKKLTFIMPEGFGVCAFTQMEEGDVCQASLIILPTGGAEREVWVVNKNGESNKLKFRFLTSQCGDGVCQDVTCAAIGCPEPESVQNCPQDCK